MPVLIACVVVVSMTTLGGMLMWLGWTAAKHALVTSAHDDTLAIGERIDERFERRITPGSVSLRHLAREPLVDATTLDERLRELPLLTEILMNLPSTAAAMVGYASGDFFLVRPLRSPSAAAAFDAPQGAAYLVQSITHEAGPEGKEAWLFYDDALRLLETRDRPPTGFDPRTRPWYQGAQEPGRVQFLTRPYVFFTTKEIGLTQSSAAPDRHAVVAFEQNLAELADTLKGLRVTPHTELAIVGQDGHVYGYFDLARIYHATGGELELGSVKDLGVPALTALVAQKAPPKETVKYRADGAEWYGISVPLASFRGRDLSLLMAIPDADLLASARAGLIRQLWWAAGLMAVLLAVGWFVGRRLGGVLAALTHQAQNLTRFDFSPPPPAASRVREIRQLETVLGKVCTTVQNFLATADTIGNEPGLDRMLAKVLQQTVAATGCRRGAVYLLDAEGKALTLSALADKDSGRAIAPASADAGSFARELATPAFPPDLPLSAIAGGQAGLGVTREGSDKFTVPLTNRQGTPVGLLMLEHPADVSHGGHEFRAFSEKLSGTLSSAIETRQLIEAQKALLDGLVLLVADAIDAKSPYTGGHCRRVPELATMIVERMAGETQGPYRDFQFGDAQRYEFHLGAWLHDCGKVTSPEHIIDKATKLEAIHNRIHEIRTRFEVLWRDAEIAHLHRIAGGLDPETSMAERDAAQAQLVDDFAFVAACNIGGEFMTDAAIARIRGIAERTWLRHFDDRLGLSTQEELGLDGIARKALPAEEHLLADRPEHVADWGARRPPVEKGDPANTYGFDMKLPAHKANLGEIYNLSIGRGTLTDEDRFKINDHVVQTYVMLKSLPWPAHLARVPEIAATHHERMDGKGYPRHLMGTDLSVEERVMALADVFEALTAADRPYKPAKTLSESLKIMAFMCKEGHLDPEIYRYFLESGLWSAYGARYLKPEQCDEVDIAALLALLPEAPTSPPTAEARA